MGFDLLADPLNPPPNTFLEGTWSPMDKYIYIYRPYILLHIYTNIGIHKRCPNMHLERPYTSGGPKRTSAPDEARHLLPGCSWVFSVLGRLGWCALRLQQRKPCWEGALDIMFRYPAHKVKAGTWEQKPTCVQVFQHVYDILGIHNLRD